MINYQVLRSRRKTLSLQVKSGQVIVRAPFHLDETFINDFIQKKEAWLKSKITEQNKSTDYCCNFTQGSALLLFGEQVTLNIVFANFGEKSDVFLSDSIKDNKVLNIVFSMRQQRTLLNPLLLAIGVKKQLEQYLTKQAQNIILPKVDYYAQLIQLTPTAIKIRQYRARWGSCNSRGELSFNYLLMMLPVQVIDYVVVHELCHLAHLNHSQNFWQLVARHFPDYNQAKQWIKSNQSALHWNMPILPTFK